RRQRRGANETSRRGLTHSMPGARILVGEGSAEPTNGLRTALELFSPAPVEFVFGVRRTSEGLDQIARPGVSVVAAFPGRGLARTGLPARTCDLSTYR